MKLKGLSLGQIRDSFAYRSIEELMWSTKQPCFSSWGKLWLSQRKKVLFFHQPFKEGKGHAFIFHLENTSCHNLKKPRVVNGWQQQFLAGNFCSFIRALLQLVLCKFNWTSAEVQGRVRVSIEMGRSRVRH